SRRNRSFEITDGLTIEDAVAEVTKDDKIRPRTLQRVAQELLRAIGNRAVVDAIDLQQLVAVSNKAFLVRRWACAVDERQTPNSSFADVIHHVASEVILPENGGERDIGAGGLHVFRDHCRATGVALADVVFDAEG